MPNRRLALSGVVPLVVAAVAVAGCGSDSKSADSPSTAATGSATVAASASPLKRIAYAGASDASPTFKSVGDILEQVAEVDGTEVKRFDNKLDPGQSLTNARLMVQGKPDVLVDWSAAADANKAIGQQFEQSGKPCIAVNIAIDGCAWFNISNAQLGAQGGKLAAQAAKQKGWTADDTTLLLVNMPAAGAEVNSLSNNFYEQFAKGFGGMAQVAADQIDPTTTKLGDNAIFVDGKASLEPTYQAVRRALQTIPEDRNIVVSVLNDDSGLGALRALDQAKRTANTLIASNGADANGIKQLRTNPSWILEGSAFFALWPKYILAMSKALADGQTPPELTGAPQNVITKETVDEYYDADGNVLKDPPVPASSKYLEAYGVTDSKYDVR